MHVAIRRAHADDAATLAMLCAEHARYERLMACPADHAVRLHTLLDQAIPALHAWIAWCNDEAIGYASASIDIATLCGAPFLHLDCLYVLEHWRGHGIGRQLFDTASAHARACGLKEMQWQTPDWNHDAIRFYRRCDAVELTKQRFMLTL
jgi:GNAT superfamily N-acetyltransferase